MSCYLSRIQRSAEITDPRMDEILLSQATDPTSLRADDFDGFFHKREAELIKRIEVAMGKSVVREAVEEGEEPPVEYEEEEAVA